MFPSLCPLGRTVSRVEVEHVDGHRDGTSNEEGQEHETGEAGVEAVTLGLGGRVDDREGLKQEIQHSVHERHVDGWMGTYERCVSVGSVDRRRKWRTQEVATVCLVPSGD